MKNLRFFFLASALLFLFSTSLFAQESCNVYTQRRYFEVGAEYAFCVTKDWDYKAGAYFIYGKQKSPTYSHGWGIGFDYYRNKSGDVDVKRGYADGHWEEETFKDERYNIPVFADFRFNFSRSEEPFYFNLRAGATFGFSDGGLDDGGVVASAGIGKVFKAGTVSISPYVRADIGTIVQTGSGWIEPLVSLGVNIRF